MSSKHAPRAKRDAYVRTHDQPADNDEDGPTTKKPRFDYRNPSTLAPDAPEEDDVLDLDEIGKAGGGVKRNAVNIDGYESDSDNDNFDARAREKARREKASELEEANDMFADLEEGDGDEDEEEGAGAGSKKKDVRFLDADEIEGQVASSKSGGHVSADFTLGAAGKGKRRTEDQEEESSSESGDDEERDRVGSDVDEEIGAGGKKKHAPKLDAFNMRNEQEEGRFDETGNFVRKAMDPDALHDNWLEGVSKKDMKRAKEAQEQREKEQRQKDRDNDALLTSDLLATLIRNMQIGETVLEALQRLNKSKAKSKPVPKWKQKKKDKQIGHANGDAMDVDADIPPEDAAETKRKAAVEAITGAADQLMTRGDLEIYDHEREILMRQYKRETGDDWAEERRTEDERDGETGEGKMWEYHWADGRDGDQIHGPYDYATMKAWNEAGYFGEGFECRPAGGGADWSRVADF